MTIPIEKELNKFFANYSKDSDFDAFARLLQSKWRKKKNYPINRQPRSNYGNFLETQFAKRTKVNFLSEDIRQLVTEKIKEIRKNGGLIGEPRIWNNLLSSQPLCFNLFSKLYYDKKLATKYFQELFGSQISVVNRIDFEFSSVRNKPDGSAFDVFVEYLNKDQKCFMGIKVKYQETLKEESKKKALEIFENHKEDYTPDPLLTNNSNIFIPNAIEKLKLPPL